MTKRGKPKPIDRIQDVCPNCHCVEVEDPGVGTGLSKGQFLTMEEFQESYKSMPSGLGWRAPQAKSTIDPVAGNKKYDEPQKIIEDPRQLRKFFGEFVWNYFRQQINENKRKEHRKEPVSMMGDTDYLVTMEIISLCNEREIDYNFCFKTQPRDGKYTIRILGLMTPPEFTAEFAQLKARAALLGVPIVVTPSTIEVALAPDAPPLPIQVKYDKDDPEKIVDRWQIKVYRPEHVSVLDNFACVSEEQDSDFTISQISYRTVGGERMDLEDHVTSVDNDEVMRAIRESLPDGDCKDVFDIISGQGETYVRFSEEYGDGQAAVNHIATFLGITTRAVNQHKQTIHHHCLANNFVPENRG
jgi:hypothetical protein